MKRALIIGAWHGNLGEAIGHILGKEAGYNVYTVDKLAKTDWNHMDVTDFTSVQEKMKRLQPLDLVVYSAGINRMGDIRDYSESDFIEHMLVNTYGAFLAIKHYVKSFEEYKPKSTYGIRREVRQKKLIIVTSNTAFIPRTRSVAYCTSKAATNMLVKQAHRELAPDGYKIIGFAPGVIEDTYMHRKTHEELERLRGWSEEHSRKVRTDLIPMRRFTNTKECAEAVAFLASKAGDYFGGEIVRFGGGEK